MKAALPRPRQSPRWFPLLRLSAIIGVALALVVGAAHAAALRFVTPPSIGQVGHGQTIDLWNRPGGYTAVFVDEARVWMKQGKRLVIHDWQQSAAAIQVVWYKQHGGSVCTGKAGFNADPALYFHLSSTGGHPAEYLGPAVGRKIGPLTTSLKRFSPAEFDIGPC